MASQTGQQIASLCAPSDRYLANRLNKPLFKTEILLVACEDLTTGKMVRIANALEIRIICRMLKLSNEFCAGFIFLFVVDWSLLWVSGIPCFPGNLIGFAQAALCRQLGLPRYLQSGVGDDY